MDECNKITSRKFDLRFLLDIIVVLILSMVLYNLGVSSLLYLAPLLVFAARYGKKNGTIIIVLALILCFSMEAIEVFSSGIGKTSIFELALLMYIPMSLSAAGILWIFTNRMRLVPRLLLSLLPAILFAIAFSVLLFVDRALFEELYAQYKDAFVALLAPIFESFEIKFDMDFAFLLFLVSAGSMILPTAMAAICANCFIYETVLHSRESNWEDKVRGIEFSPNMVWGFIASIALILLFYFISAPIALEVVVVNIAFLFAVLYSVQGFAVLFSWLGRSMERMKSMSLFIVLFIIATVVPGINFIVLLILPLLGLLESFFDLKKIGEKK